MENTAKKLSLPFQALCRIVPTKQHLLRILFERAMSQLSEQAEESLKESDDPRECLRWPRWVAWR